MDDNSEHGTKYVSLQPFIHQVGGHSSMLCLDEATVCKPVVQRELQFYETLPERLKTFVPSFYGTIKVHLYQDGDYITLKASCPTNYKSTSTSMNGLRIRRSGSLEIDGAAAMFESESTNNGGAATMNPWMRKCLKEYILNITAQIEKEQNPLDLKMGTRQYGDNDCLAKRQSKMVKVISTTSAKLGVRIGGMQVYQTCSGKFLCRNKLYGRTLSPSGFKSALHSFLHNGMRLRTDAVPPLIRRLEELHSRLTELESVRLFTTSLLLLYEGHDPVRTESDKEKSERTEKNKPKLQVKEERAERASSVDRDKLALPKEDFRLRTSSCSPKEKKHFRPVDIQEEEPLTDVRLIDFAHSTHSGFGDKVVHSGPDNGFLFGLDNLIQILKAILVDSQ